MSAVPASTPGADAPQQPAHPPAHTPRAIKLTLAYDGTDFKGWQVQTSGVGEDFGERSGGPARTVQGVLEETLRTVTGQSLRIIGAGRTDAGVHARGQVACFTLREPCNIPTPAFVRALNTRLPADLAVVASEDVPLDFHAQRDAKGKIYSYALFVAPERNPLERLQRVHVRFPLDLDRMREGARHLTGTHDFTSFASNLNQTQALRRAEGKRDLETVRTVRRIEFLVSERDPRCITMEIEGSGFLYQMVRTIAGSLIEVGRGFKPPEWIAAARDARDRRQAGPAAPPHGLCLERVFY